MCYGTALKLVPSKKIFNTVPINQTTYNIILNKNKHNSYYPVNRIPSDLSLGSSIHKLFIISNIFFVSDILTTVFVSMPHRFKVLKIKCYDYYVLRFKS